MRAPCIAPEFDLPLGRGEMASAPIRRKSKREQSQHAAELKRLEAALDEGLQETFPASDAVAVTQPRRQSISPLDTETPRA